MIHSILAAIGNTPIVEIRKLNPNPKVKILAKLEYFNPGGSIKDRPALYMIEEAEKSGLLTPNKTVIEATSGNTGIGLALVCAVKGYKLLLTMSEAVSVERQKILKARGAEILLTPDHLGTDGAIEEVYRLARENPDTYYMTDQFNNEANCLAHYHGTAEEIWEQTKGNVSMIVATMGTTGTLMGISKRLKEYNPDIKIVGVEPYLGHKIQGLKNMKEAYRPEIFEKNRLDKIVNIEDEKAFEMTRKLAKEEGLLVGMSSGAAMVIAGKEAEAMTEGTIVVIFPDSGERYLSTPLFTVQDKVDLQFFNTMSRTKEAFEPIKPGKVSIYSCGPTAHARMDLGECRRFVFADLLSRYLDFRGYSVTHIMNITDMDDKTINGSEKAGLSLSEFTEKHIDYFKKDLAALNIKPATEYPKASEHIEDMVLLAKKLVNKGFAYEKLHSLYFDISRFSDYGRLSGIDINKIKIGATVELDEYEKDNPRDFTLLKRSKLSELKRGIYVKTDWGNVRPSWHIQCAAMSMKYLGEFFDIHTSSRALVFPHHENEIAIAQSLTGKPLCKYWIHCDQVLTNDKNMNNKENRLGLEELYDLGFSGREIRYWLFSSHYRKPINFSVERLEYAKHSLKRLDTCIHTLINIKEKFSYPELDQLIYDIKHGFVTAMDDDLNISAALASIFNIIKQINILILKKMIGKDDSYKIIDAFRNIDSVLGIFNFGDEFSNPEILRLIEERNKARAEKNWDIADKIREQLISLGVTVKDNKIM
ncbi:MAG: cysteine--tRNA ligase [Proteobacteria bacterium]|nr:cysteine--tRNA ligase [Pseudomonadota bacterium]MBU4258038.1 cysteine--tRNA ligase [Pseudomonadota bacterium]MBU4289416.1 cysteine--tRNA ligase [Pseudomonadota bacterium]MBU4414675.1 cysteine--tRNA ligase [Pseudomonadota bacterium]MCG2757407.1 cysteine--tRNA ligase [Desulfobacteraceae bacterium]